MHPVPPVPRESVRLLGPLEVTGPAGVVRLSGRRQRTLLAVLALRAPGVVSRPQLVDALWGTEPPPTAVKTLHSHLARIRQALDLAGLGDLLVTVEPGYALRLPADRLDLTRFEDRVRRGRAALRAGDVTGAAAVLREALALWRGDPLADCPVAEWAHAEVARLHEVGACAAEALAEADLRRGEPGAAVDALERLVARHPLRERPWELLMIAHHRAGRQGDALRAYRRARSVLVAELGVEPGPELRRLEAAVLAGATEVDPPTAPPRPVAPEVRPAPPGLVGRQRELADVLRLLDRSRLVTLTGPGGCGKTRLALAAAGAATLVDLTPVTAPDLVADAVATALGVPERPGADRADTVADALGEAERLVVLDNCEHLPSACAALVSRLLAACPGLRVLATSRAALRVVGEVAYEVPPLAVPDPDVPRSLAELAVYDSVQLFLDRAAEQGVHGFADTDAEAIARLCAALDGLPLAIELAAARSPVLSPAQIVRRLRDRFGLLTFGASGRTLLATLEWSLDLLTPDEADLFARLAVFAGGFTVEAAEAVGRPGRVLDALSGLVAKSLVRARGRRFSMLETIGAYAASLDPADAAHRHAEYFLALAEAADGEPSGARLRELGVEHDNLRAALAHLAGLPDPAGELRLAAALCRYCHLHGHYREGRQWLDRALARGQDSAEDLGKVLGRALAGAASLALFECDYGQAAAHATAALERAGEDPRRTGRLRRLLGSVARERARYPEAMRWYAASRESFQAAGDAFGVAYSDQLAGATAWLAGDLDTATVRLSASLAGLREVGDEKGAASSTAYLGAVAAYRDDAATARLLLDEALDVFGRLEFKEGIAWALNLLGVTEYRSGRLARAESLLRTSLAGHRELGDRWRQASVLEALAAVAVATGDPAAASALLGEADALREAIGAPVPAVEAPGLARIRAVLAHAGPAVARHLVGPAPALPG